MRHVIKLRNDGEPEFMTRAQGERLRARLKKDHAKLASGDVLAIDFSGIEVMTPSFADECFGKLAEKLGVQRFRESMQLVGANDTLRALINAVLSERTSIAPQKNCPS